MKTVKVIFENNGSVLTIFDVFDSRLIDNVYIINGEKDYMIPLTSIRFIEETEMKED